MLQEFSTSKCHANTMDSVQYTASNKKLQLVKINVPESIASNSVLIKVIYAGICGTDLHLIDVS